MAGERVRVVKKQCSAHTSDRRSPEGPVLVFRTSLLESRQISLVRFQQKVTLSGKLRRKAMAPRSERAAQGYWGEFFNKIVRECG
jgi:hypothetical protein